MTAILKTLFSSLVTFLTTPSAARDIAENLLRNYVKESENKNDDLLLQVYDLVKVGDSLAAIRLLVEASENKTDDQYMKKLDDLLSQIHN